MSSISRRIWAIRASIVGLRRGAVGDRGRVLGDDDPAGLAQDVQPDLVELEPDLGGDDLGAGDDREVLQERLAAVAEERRLDRDGGEGLADRVDDQRGQRLAVDVLGDDDQRLAGLDDLLQQRQQVGDRGDLLGGDQQVRVVEAPSRRPRASVTKYGQM